MQFLNLEKWTQKNYCIDVVDAYRRKKAETRLISACLRFAIAIFNFGLTKCADFSKIGARLFRALHFAPSTAVITPASVIICTFCAIFNRHADTSVHPYTPGSHTLLSTSETHVTPLCWTLSPAMYAFVASGCSHAGITSGSGISTFAQRLGAASGYVVFIFFNYNQILHQQRPDFFTPFFGHIVNRCLTLLNAIRPEFSH